MGLPDGYLAAEDRKELLGRWGFSCGCARCTHMPDVTRAFVCSNCHAPELCPVDSVVRPERIRLTCRSCGSSASEEYTELCYAHEAKLRERAGNGPWFGVGSEDKEGDGDSTA